MAPKFVMRVVRMPQPGKAFEVLDKVLEFRRAAGATGLTTLGVFSPTPAIVTTTPFDSLTAAEELVDGVLSSPDRRKAYDDIGALCVSTANTMNRIIEPGSGRETAKWIQRYVFTPAPGSTRGLIAALAEFGSHSDGPKAAITNSMNGPQVVASLAMDSLSTLEERSDALANDLATQTRAAAVVSQVETWFVGISKVYRS